MAADRGNDLELAASAPPAAGPGRRGGVLGGVRKVVVAIIGSSVVIVGLAMVVLPGPAIVVIPAGLAILATEFLWARRLLRYAKERTAGMLRAARS